MRGRNRGGGGGKGPNPLSRTYESNGPDVKIRGTASHIADKYVQLSRDAQASGDPVAAENYMQHAEHYYRLLAAAQAQFQPNAVIVRADDEREEYEDSGEESEAAAEGESAENVDLANAPQPTFGEPREGRERDNDNQRDQRRDRNRDAAAEGQEGERQPGRGREWRRGRNRNAPQGDEQPQAPAAAAGDGDEQSALPAFITGTPAAKAAAPVPAPAAEPAAETPAAPTASDTEAEAPAPRTRRRRYSRTARSEDGADAAPARDEAPAE
ncbi:DUF4167 domain-containing protein [Agaricicola taiwanensis]|nr:DUF4167 domain-containing protein [Agaricicola taiwanensis]